MRDKSRPGLYQRNGWWHVAIYPPKGSSAKAIRRTLDTKEHTLAAEWYDANAGQIRQDLWREANGFKVERYWEEAAAVYVSESKRVDWGPDAQRLQWVNSKLNGMTLKSINREFWKRITDAKVADNIRERGECSGATPNRLTALVSAVLNKAARELAWLETVPRFYSYDESDGRERVFSTEEAKSIANALTEFATSMFRFSLATGLRQGNVLALRWDWVDMATRVIRIPKECFKQRRVHVQALNESALAIIRSQPGFLQPAEGRQPFVFLRDGEPITKAVLRHEWDDTIAKLGIADAHWHDTRRTWATWLREAGVSLDDAMLLGGWASKDMLHKVYSKPSVGFMVGKVESLDSLLRTISPQKLEAVG